MAILSRREILAVPREDSSEQVLSMTGVGKRSITMPLSGKSFWRNAKASIAKL
jgi:hypothetical protein